ncbi:MAG: hypothetical protein IPM74_06965 [Crocinitomicaceae bacterium]|nr:hypothetical protein [Crocinitomicaceae bacterium]MBK8925640.1 hypothetical protein [Crocinitomicaceae bacterium]
MLLTETGYYRESGKVSVPGLVLTTLIALVVIWFLAFIYAILLFLIPVVYLNIVICVGYSLIIGIIILLLARLAKNRNRKARIIHALVIGFFGVYFAWTAYLSIALFPGDKDFTSYLSMVPWILQPKESFSAMGYALDYGMWSVFGSVINGWQLLLIWIIEAAIMLSGPVIATLKTKEYPFSENTNQWFPKFTLHRDFESIVVTTDLVESLRINPVLALESIGKGTGNRFTKFHLFYLKQEEQAYLTAEKVYFEGQGKGNKHQDIVLNNFPITRKEAEDIMAKFDHNRERFHVF